MTQKHEVALDSAKRLRGNNPHEKPDLKTEPYAIYFYYFRPSRYGNEPRILFFQSKANKITSATIRRIASEYAECAAIGIDVPPPCKPGFHWRKKSYLVIMVDEDNWQFDYPAIEFDAHATGNHTFYHGDYDEVTIEPQGEKKRKRQIFYCINHMLQAADSDADIGNQSQAFIIKLRPVGAQALPYTADGTNLGPPVPPPATAEGLFKWLLHVFGSLLHFLKLK